MNKTLKGVVDCDLIVREGTERCGIKVNYVKNNAFFKKTSMNTC